jgi:hypothetical protein
MKGMDDVGTLFPDEGPQLFLVEWGTEFAGE